MEYVPDSYDMFEIHDAQQESWLERRPKCDNCGEHIQDDYLYDFDGFIICEKCLKDDYRQDADNYEKEI